MNTNNNNGIHYLYIISLVLLILVICIKGSQSHNNDNDYHFKEGESSNFERGCATHQLTDEEKESIESDLDSIRLSSNRIEYRQTTEIPFNVYWHVITDGGASNIPDTQIQAQIDVVNAAFINTSFVFYLKLVDRTVNPQWMNIEADSNEEDDMKAALRLGNERDLNLYSTTMKNNILGFAYFPNAYGAQPLLDGVVFDYRSVPGGVLAPYNLGQTATHEIGHWMGLYHTFEGGCGGQGDTVADTPSQRDATNGCPTRRDSCPAAGLDPVHNFMDYSTDLCMYEFTAGQVSRMRLQFERYRNVNPSENIGQDPEEKKGGGSKSGTIAAVVVTLIIVIGVAAIIAFLLIRRRKRQQQSTQVAPTRGAYLIDSSKYNPQANTSSHLVQPQSSIASNQSIHATAPSSGSNPIFKQQPQNQQPQQNQRISVQQGLPPPVVPPKPKPGTFKNAAKNQEFCVGMICLAEFSGDGRYYRAEIEDYKDGQYLVQFVDFEGAREWVLSKNMKASKI